MRALKLAALAMLMPSAFATATAAPVPIKIHGVPTLVVQVAQCCTCARHGSPQVGCIKWNCSECQMSAPINPIRSARQCRRGSRMLVCDGKTSCDLTCKPAEKKKETEKEKTKKAPPKR